jgi:hypothetical protein
MALSVVKKEAPALSGARQQLAQMQRQAAALQEKRKPLEEIVARLNPVIAAPAEATLRIAALEERHAQAEADALVDGTAMPDEPPELVALRVQHETMARRAKAAERARIPHAEESERLRAELTVLGAEMGNVRTQALIDMMLDQVRGDYADALRRIAEHEAAFRGLEKILMEGGAHFGVAARLWDEVRAQRAAVANIAPDEGPARKLLAALTADAASAGAPEPPKAA